MVIFGPIAAVHTAHMPQTDENNILFNYFASFLARPKRMDLGDVIQKYEAKSILRNRLCDNVKYVSGKA